MYCLDYHQPQSSRETTLTADRRRGRLKEWAWTKWLKRSWRLPRDKRGSKERPLICNKTVTSMRARGISVQPRKEPLLPLETGHLCNWQTIFWGTANTWGRLSTSTRGFLLRADSTTQWDQVSWTPTIYSSGTLHLLLLRRIYPSFCSACGHLLRPKQCTQIFGKTMNTSSPAVLI